MMKCRKCAPNWRLVLTRHLLCHRPHHLFLLHLFHLPRPHLLPWVGTVLFFAATLGVPTQSPRLAQFGSVKYTARALGATYTGPRLARVTSVACVVATPLSPGLVPAASAPCIAPACDARFIAGASQCVPRQIVPFLRALLALSALVRRIVLTHNVLEVVKILHIILGHLDLHVRTC